MFTDTFLAATFWMHLLHIKIGPDISLLNGPYVCWSRPVFTDKQPFQGTVDFFLDFCFAAKTCRVKIVSGKNDILREIVKNCSSKLSFLQALELSIDHFWWTILDNSTLNIIFTANIFDPTFFHDKTKIQEKAHCATFQKMWIFIYRYFY